MHKRKSNFIIGTWSLSGDYGKIQYKKITQTIDECIKNDFYEFDTAPTYGKGLIEKVLSRYKKENKNIKINTKCGYNSKFEKTFNIKDIRISIEKSLDLFEKINHLYLHNPRDEIRNWSAVLEVLNEYKNKGLISKIGISLAKDYFFNNEILNKFDVVMDEFNILRSTNLRKIERLKPKFVARSVFANGLLTKKKINQMKFTIGDHRKLWLKKNRIQAIENQVEQIKQLFSNDLKLVSMNFLISLKNINKIIVGVKNKDHVKWLSQNILKLEKLKKNEIDQIIKLNEDKFYNYKKNIY